MNVTALCELRSAPGQAEAVVQRALEQLSLPSSNVAGRRGARLYQHVDDPAWLLYLADWRSREAFEAYRRSAPVPGAPNQFQQVPACRLYRRLALFERVMVPAALLRIDIVDGPAETYATRRDRSLAYHRSVARGRSGLVLLQVHEAIDNPTGLLIVSGWETAGDLSDPVAQEPDQTVGDLTVGGTLRRFVGRALIDTTDA